MNKFLRAIFPLYNTGKHSFLLSKWWFRLLIVLYIIVIIVGWGVISNSYAYSSWGWCYDLAIYSNNMSERFEQCGMFLDDSRWQVLGSSILSIIVIHYLIQLVFFKLIINFIVLGNKK